jgi:2-polyprenyl-6-methoxyphenol hydroxylase-like FAD-dependent oxidoreductase
MGTAVIAGGSVAGLVTALALAEAGFRVQVLESSEPPPDGPAGPCAERWRRPTVPQAHHSHTLTSLGVRVLSERAPRILSDLLAAGARLLDLTDVAPQHPCGQADPQRDAVLRALGVRRSVLDLVLYRSVRALPGVRISHRSTVSGLLTDPAERRVTGVITRSGQRLCADVVIDATGRKARSRQWLRAAGLPVPADMRAPSGLRGFTRFYRLRGAAQPGPLNRGNAAGGIWDHYAGVLHPGDNGTFAVALATLPGDTVTGVLRHPAAFTAAARATPHVGCWLAEGVSEPLGPVEVITCPPNALRGAAVAQPAPVHGLFPVGDAACVTNPLFGRGLSLAMAHAFRLAELLRGRPAIDEVLSGQAAAAADELLRPWYEQSARDDRRRLAAWRAAAGLSARGSTTTTAGVPGRPAPEALAAGAAGDMEVWRGVTRFLMTLSTPAEVFDDAAFRARVAAAPPTAPPVRPPTRDALVKAVTATTTEEAPR